MKAHNLHGCLTKRYTGAYLRERLVESLVLILLNFLSWSLPDGLDIIHQFPVPHGLLNLQQTRQQIFKISPKIFLKINLLKRY